MLLLDQVAVTSAGNTDGYMVNFDSAGKISWAKSIGGIGHDNISAVAVDATDNNYIDPKGMPIFTRVISGQIGAIRVAADGLSSILLGGTGTNVSFALGMSSLPNGGVFLTRIAP